MKLIFVLLLVGVLLIGCLSSLEGEFMTQEEFNPESGCIQSAIYQYQYVNDTKILWASPKLVFIKWLDEGKKC